MNTLTINVPEGPLADEVDSWQDGATYSLTVKQTGAGQFDLVSGSAEAEEEAPENPEGEQPMEKPGKMMHKNPAIAIILGGKPK